MGAETRRGRGEDQDDDNDNHHYHDYIEDIQWEYYHIQGYMHGRHAFAPSACLCKWSIAIISRPPSNSSPTTAKEHNPPHAHKYHHPDIDINTLNMNMILLQALAKGQCNDEKKGIAMGSKKTLSRLPYRAS